MKKTFIFTICIFFICLASFADKATNIIERAALSSRRYEAGDGVYTFSTKWTIPIYGMKPLYVLVYRNSTPKPGRSGDVLIDFAIPHGEDELQVFCVANYATKAPVPILDAYRDIEVFPGNGEAEIILKWRHPPKGEFRRLQKYLWRDTPKGEFRTIEKYLYTGDSVVLVNRSTYGEYVEGENNALWISESALKKLGIDREKVLERARSAGMNNE